MVDSHFPRNNGLDLGATQAAGQAASTANRAARNTESLERRVDKLTLICWAMWSLIQETTDLTEEDLITRFRQLDALDGKSDGKVAREIVNCSKCGRVVAREHNRCLYCGAEQPILSVFDLIL